MVGETLRRDSWSDTRAHGAGTLLTSFSRSRYRDQDRAHTQIEHTHREWVMSIFGRLLCLAVCSADHTAADYVKIVRNEESLEYVPRQTKKRARNSAQREWSDLNAILGCLSPLWRRPGALAR